MADTLEIPETFTPQRTYGVYLEWDHDDTDISLAISDRILGFKSDGLIVTDQIAGPCWSYQLSVTGKTEKRVRDFVDKVFRLLKRRGAQLYHLSGTVP